MKFHLDTEQIAIQDSLLGVCQSVLSREALLEFLDSGQDHHAESWQAIMELGLGGLLVPEEQGGVGLGLLEAAISMEVLGKRAAPGPVLGQLLLGVLSERMKEKGIDPNIITGLISGERIATCAFGGGWTPESWEVVFDDQSLSGDVEFVPSGQSADVILVGTKGGGLALITERTNIEAFQYASTDRTRLMSRLTFADTPAIELCAPGDDLVQRIFDAALILMAADALGGAQHCVDLSVEYAMEREQFGQPIGKFQAVKHQLATMAMGAESARSLVWYATYAWDQDLPDASRVAALAKAHLCDRYVEIARDAVAVHGGIGYTWEYGLNIWFRRSIHDAAFLGASSLHRARAADLAGW